MSRKNNSQRRRGQRKKGVLPLILRAAKIVGEDRPNISALARAIGAPRTALYLWRDIPPVYVMKIVHATKGQLTAHQLRPDVFDEG